MLDRALEYLPGLGKLSSLRAWTGFRAATPDKLPLIGPHVEHERLYLATGHEGLGITTSLATLSYSVAQIMNPRNAIPVTPYLPARMARGAVHA
jgi:glycine/D-amino acid oxidase-like deaminating enzyme